MVKKGLTPSRIIFLGYVTIILIGTLLLALPIASNSQSKCSLIDSIFTATSSVCVTGLIVKNIGYDFSLFGKVVILVLIQIGGLGYMTIASILFSMIGRRLSLKQDRALSETTGSFPGIETRRFALRILATTIAFEFIGAIILSVRFKSLGYGIFHAVSAFCNAGFSLFSDSFIRFSTDPFVIFTISGLFIIGGLGFIVLKEIKNLLNPLANGQVRRHLSLHAKVVLLSTFILLILGTFAILGMEWNNGLRDMPLWSKIFTAFFQSATPRTAGFSSIDLNNFRDATIVLTMLFMFIGASPAGTGGGIKTTTFALCIMGLLRWFMGREDVSLLRRRINMEIITKTFIIFLSALIIIGTGVFILTLSQQGVLGSHSKGFLGIVFEEFSAFATCGLSMGSSVMPGLSLSYDFNLLGKIVIILTMLAGRVGILIISTAIISHRGKESFKYPEERVLTG